MGNAGETLACTRSALPQAPFSKKPAPQLEELLREQVFEPLL
jgi:hypothetical protein